MYRSQPSVKCVGAVSLVGVQGTRIIVEGVISHQLPGISIIGLPDAAIGEAKQRVKLAAQSVGLKLSAKHVVINLSPAALPKHGSSFDLAIALAALSASGVLSNDLLRSVAHIGELGLDGSLRRPVGLFTLVKTAKESGFLAVMVPNIAASEACLLPGMIVIAVGNLLEAVQWYATHSTIPPYVKSARSGDRSINVHRVLRSMPCNVPQINESNISEPAGESCDELYIKDHGPSTIPRNDMSEIVGQSEAIEALVVAAAGRHHVSLTGPPGSGKSMMAERLTSILPCLTEEEAVEATSIAALDFNCLDTLVFQPPFQNPHHSLTTAGLIGGVSGGYVRIGAATKASLGVLYLDEAPEFNRAVIDSLREPLESKSINLHRNSVHAILPANFQLVLASNPCPCGNSLAASSGAVCTCSESKKLRYMQRLSGPLLDRIDVNCRLRRVSRVAKSSASQQTYYSSEKLKSRVTQARLAAAERFEKFEWKLNADIPASILRNLKFRPAKSTTTVLDRALELGTISLRGYDRILRLSWSVADLSGHTTPTRDDVGYALSLRNPF